MPQPDICLGSHSTNSGYIQTKNVHPFIYGIVANGLATYYEIMHIYSFDEILDLIEILIVKRENESIDIELIKKKRGG